MVAVSAELGEALGRVGTRRRVRRGERLLREGSRTGAVLFVLSGSLRVEVTTEDGDDIVLAIRCAGDLLGDLGPISESRAGASVVAREASDIVVVRSDRFLDTIRDDAFGAQLIARLAALLDESDRRRVRWLSQPLRARVVHELVLLDDIEGSDDHSVATTQSELAGLAGCSRSAVAGALSELRDEGLVSSTRGRIRILDPEALRREIDPSA